MGPSELDLLIPRRDPPWEIALGILSSIVFKISVERANECLLPTDSVTLTFVTESDNDSLPFYFESQSRNSELNVITDLAVLIADEFQRLNNSQAGSMRSTRHFWLRRSIGLSKTDSRMSRCRL